MSIWQYIGIEFESICFWLGFWLVFQPKSVLELKPPSTFESMAVTKYAGNWHAWHIYTQKGWQKR